MFTQTFTLSTVRGEEFTFQSPNAEDIRDLVVYFLEGLKKRSSFVISLQDYKAPGRHDLDFVLFHRIIAFFHPKYMNLAANWFAKQEILEASTSLSEILFKKGCSY